MHSMLVAPQGGESFQACCQWALLNVQIITLLVHLHITYKQAINKVTKAIKHAN